VQRVLILSPARTSGKRAALVFNVRAEFDLAVRLRQPQGVAIGEVFSFLSGLYFRGKLAYANFFGRPPSSAAPAYVISSDAGLMPSDERVTLERLRAFGQVPIDPLEPLYSEPLRQSAQKLRAALGAEAEVVLLGSIATNKYVDLLLEQFGEKLLYPKEFVGRGDMSRGGLLLRAVESGQELEYLSISAAAARRGKRPAKLEPKRPAPRPAPRALKRRTL